MPDNNEQLDPNNQDLGLHFTDDELDELERVNDEIAAEARQRKEAKAARDKEVGRG